MNKSEIRRAVKKALLELGDYKNIKVYDVNSDTDYTGSTWLNIEVKLDEKKKRKR